MVNRNYHNGRNKEYREKYKLEAKGYTCLRSAGSHSPFDVIGINPITRHIALIQCKPKSMSDKKKLDIEESNKMFNGIFNVSFEVV